MSSSEIITMVPQGSVPKTILYGAAAAAAWVVGGGGIVARLLQSKVPRSRSAGQFTSKIPMDVTVTAGPTALHEAQPSNLQ